jgi:site-specific DNA recombinase
MNDTTGIKAVIYCRFSPQRKADDCESNETQLDYCEQHCKSKGYEIAAKFADASASGDSEDRPGLWNAISALKRGMVLLVYRLDRLARSVYLSEYIHREVGKKKCRIESVTTGMCGDSPDDVLLRQITSSFFEYERKIIAARTRAAVLRHQANGFAVSKDPPYGKQIGPPKELMGKMRKTLVDDPVELAVIDHIMQLRADGLGLREIARRLDDEGIDARGREWNHVTVSRILARSGERG